MVWRLMSRCQHFHHLERTLISCRLKEAVPLFRYRSHELHCGTEVTSTTRFQSSGRSLLHRFLRKIIPARMAETDKAASIAIVPPDIVRGMKTLDRDAFSLNVNVPCFVVPNNQIKVVMDRFKKHLLRVPKIKPVEELSENDHKSKTHKLFLLDPQRLPSVEGLSSEDKEFLRSCGVDTESTRTHEIHLTYNNWKYDDILKAVLPEDSDAIGGFSQIGHIIHLNLRDELFDYKKIIGEVLLDKVPSSRTVVNKVGTIDTVYRYFAMEVLAGEDNMIATTTEWGVTYQFDFSKVYWNPRLSSEHKRVVDDLERGDVVFDVFAGVGPFAVPAAKKGVTVLANDLNPESYKWLNQNAKQKLKAPLRTFNLDGRDFIRDVVKKDLLDRWKGVHADQQKMETPDLNRIHFFMNLPDIAIEFLDVFPGLFSDVDPDTLVSLKLPRVYCYCFSKSETPEQDAKERAEGVLGCSLEEGHIIRMVRNVAPNKEMLCVIFTLQKETLFGKIKEIAEPPEKKSKVTNA